MYDITKIFQEIENQLISSMCRNLSRHIDEEQDANANYSQWQTKQLQALERYRKENLKEFSKQFEDINNGLKKYLEMTYNNFKTATEHDIISNLDRNSDAIGVNQEKLNALIKSVTDDFQKAEYSLLRCSNDLYRQTIYKAQIGLNTGSITLNQAIDMATKDFLSNGINSIRYKNGNLVNIASYSEMALRTAEKRATMYGDGEKRQEWDIDTVIVYGHNGACPLCSRWQNRVYIDDVYSNGKPNNKYPLLSVAIQGGLYHPNCKCPPPQTYIESITEPPTQKTPQELEKDIQNYNLEQVQRYNERQIRKYKRLESNSLDDANKKRYSLKVKEWQSKQRDFINAHPKTLRRDYSREKVRVLNIAEPLENNSTLNQNSLSENNKRLKDSLRQSNYKWNSKDNIEKAKYNVQNCPLESRIEKIKEKISKYGLKEDYIHEAGNCLLDDMIVLYDKSNQNKNLYKQLKKQLDNKISNGIYNEEVEKLFKKMEDMEVIENHSLVLKNTLSRIRKVGYDNKEVYNHLKGFDRISVDIVAQAYQYLPEDWIKSSLQKGKIMVQYKERGEYQNNNNLLLTDNTLHTSIHELVHRMEYTHKGLLQAEKQFYNRRTKNEPLTKLIDIFPDSSYDDWEVTRKDKFVNPYMGKDYNGDAYELLTMGLELLYSNPEKVWKDKDMTTWLYGILVLL